MAGVKALVIGMGVLLIAGFVVVAVTLVNRASSSKSAETARADVALQPGETLADVTLSDGQALFHIQTRTGARIEVRDIRTGDLRAEFKVAPASP